MLMFLFVGQMLSYLFLIRISCLFHCSGLRFIHVSRFCLSLGLRYCIILIVHFHAEFFSVFSLGLRRILCDRIWRPNQRSVYGCLRTYSPHLYELF